MVTWLTITHIFRFRKFSEAIIRGNEPDLARRSENQIPAALRRRFEVLVKPQTDEQIIPIREIKADCIGQLISMKVMFRTSDYKNVKAP